MKTKTNFLIYTFFVTISILIGVFLTEGSPLEKMVPFGEYIVKGCCKSVGLLYLAAILFCWINNIALLLFFLCKKREIFSVNLYPILIVREKGKIKIKLWFNLNALVDWYTSVSLEKMDCKAKINEYIAEWECFLKKLLVLHIILGGISVLLSFYFGLLGIWACACWFTINSFYRMSETKTIREGMFLYGTTVENIYCIFLNMDLEEFNKTTLYNEIQKKYMNKIPETINEKMFLNQILIDSIYDETDYLCVELYDYLYDKFLDCNFGQLKGYAWADARMFFLFYTYLKEVKRVDANLQKMMRDIIHSLETFYSNTPYCLKLFINSKERELFNPKYKFDYYKEKICLVYGKVQKCDEVEDTI